MIETWQPPTGPQKPAPTGLQLAVLSQRAINEFRDKAQIEASLIRQLLQGRHVRNIRTDTIYLVREIRLGVNWTVTLWGITRTQRRLRLIGTVMDIEMVVGNSVPPLRSDKKESA